MVLCGYGCGCVLTVRSSRAHCQTHVLYFPVLTVKASAYESANCAELCAFAGGLAPGSNHEPEPFIRPLGKPWGGKFDVAACPCSACDVLSEVVLKFYPSAIGVMLDGAASIVWECAATKPPVGEGFLLLF